jgi:excisionase family DNA binding protein
MCGQEGQDMTKTTTAPYISVKQCAEDMGVSADTIYAACEAGQLPAIRVGSGRGSWRIHRDKLDGMFEVPSTARVNSEPVPRYADDAHLARMAGLDVPFGDDRFDPAAEMAEPWDGADFLATDEGS